jgi:hypothetical protein
MNTPLHTKEFIPGRLYRRNSGSGRVLKTIGQIIMVLRASSAYPNTSTDEYMCVTLVTSSGKLLADILLYNDEWVEL